MLAPSQTGVWLSVSIGCQGREEGVVQIYQNDISAGNQSDFWRKKCPQYLWIKIILVQKNFYPVLYEQTAIWTTWYNFDGSAAPGNCVHNSNFPSSAFFPPAQLALKKIEKAQLAEKSIFQFKFQMPLWQTRHSLNTALLLSKQLTNQIVKQIVRAWYVMAIFAVYM